MIDIKPLRYFIALAETLHFGKAAIQLHMSQPPLSRQLSALEAALGVKLIERSPHNVVLTAAGKRFHTEREPSSQRWTRQRRTRRLRREETPVR